MIVLLHNNWFDGAKFYEKGRVEYNGLKADLPSDAIVLSEDGSLPVASNSPKAGFGAKPIEEQIMDLAGMGPTHQISFPVDSTEPLSEDEVKEREASALEERKKAALVRKDERDAGIEQLRAETETGIAAAKAAFELVQPAIDPLAAVQETGPVTTLNPDGEPESEGSPLDFVPDEDKNESPDPFKPSKKK